MQLKICLNLPVSQNMKLYFSKKHAQFEANLHLDLPLIRSQFVPVRAQVLRSVIPLARHNAVNETLMR